VRVGNRKFRAAIQRANGPGAQLVEIGQNLRLKPRSSRPSRA
jgi:hypothetical protein